MSTNALVKKLFVVRPNARRWGPALAAVVAVWLVVVYLSAGGEVLDISMFCLFAVVCVIQLLRPTFTGWLLLVSATGAWTISTLTGLPSGYGAVTDLVFVVLFLGSLVGLILCRPRLDIP